MKRLLGGLAAVAMAAGAQAADRGTYMKADVGANYLGTIKQRFTQLPIPPTDPNFTNPRDLKMNLGVRASVAEGFLLNRFMAVEVETGLLWNELDEGVDWLMQIPILANFVLRYECKGGFGIYAGIGGGGAAAIANATTVFEDTDTTFVAAWQGMAGLSYNFTPNASIGLVYKYMGIHDPKFELSGFGITEVFKLEDIHNHYGGLQLIYSF
jgi:opacity protein-like surface antigen